MCRDSVSVYMTNMKWKFLLAMILNCHATNGNFILLKTKSISDLKNRCNGSIKVFDFQSSDRSDVSMLKSIFKNRRGQFKIWNGYYIKTNYLENIGCFKKRQNLPTHCIKDQDDKPFSIARCWTFCRLYGSSEFLIIGASNCCCKRKIDNVYNNSAFMQVSAELCSSQCKNRPEEICGSQTIWYNIYKDKQSIITKEDKNQELKLCLKGNGSENTMSMCNETVGFVCNTIGGRRTGGDKTERNWINAMKYCQSNNYSYLTSLDKYQGINLPSDLWWNERKYSDVIPDTIYPQAEIIKIESGIFKDRKVVNWTEHSVESVYFICQIGNNTNYETNLAEDEIKHGIVFEIIGGVIAILAVAGIAGFICIYTNRKRNEKEDTNYNSTKLPRVKYKTSQGVTNMSYCGTATLDILRGNPERDSSNDYTTIDEEEMHRNGGIMTRNEDKMKDNEGNVKVNVEQNGKTDSSPIYHNSSNQIKKGISDYDLSSPIIQDGTSSIYHTISLDPYDLANNVENDTEYSRLHHGINKNEGNLRDSTYAHAQPEGVDDESYAHVGQVNKFDIDVLTNELK